MRRLIENKVIKSKVSPSNEDLYRGSPVSLRIPQSPVSIHLSPPAKEPHHQTSSEQSNTYGNSHVNPTSVWTNPEDNVTNSRPDMRICSPLSMDGSRLSVAITTGESPRHQQKSPTVRHTPVKHGQASPSSSNSQEKASNKVPGVIKRIQVANILRRWATGRQGKDGTAAEEPERPDSFLERYGMATEQQRAASEMQPDQGRLTKLGNRLKKLDPRQLKTWVIDPSSTMYYRWLAVISFACLYNLVMIIARSVFWKLQDYYMIYWLVLDYVCDVIYVLDMAVQFRTGFLDQGILVKDIKQLKTFYKKQSQFRLDVISVLPTDLLYLFPPKSASRVYVRFNRLCKLPRMGLFLRTTDSHTTLPNLFRVANLFLYIVVIIHWNACIYFLLSTCLGFGSDDWVYFNISDAYPGNQSLSRMYVYSFYWSTLTLTTIGETPKPERDIEYVFVIVDFIFGVLIFATIVGNVGSMISNMNANRTEFQKHMDGVKRYMHLRGVTGKLEQRVIGWFDYVWTARGGALDEEALLSRLPERLRAEIAIHVHLATLRRVSIFQGCEPGLLVQLLLRLKLVVFSPGDYVCRRGDIGREMYIVKSGQLSVLNSSGAYVVATLGQGAVFGELSILNIPGSRSANRRNADVKSIGYSDLFVLSKRDLWDALLDFPEARTRLVERGKDQLRREGLLDESEAMRVAAQLSPEARLDAMERALDTLNTRLARLTAEFSSTQSKIKQRITVVEKRQANKTSSTQTLHPRI